MILIVCCDSGLMDSEYYCDRDILKNCLSAVTKNAIYLKQEGPPALDHSPESWHMSSSDSFTILGLWVLGLAVSNINESQLQTYESKTLFLMTSLQYYCIPGLARTR